MGQINVLAKITAADAPGLVTCRGARAGDLVAQAIAWSNGDSVAGVFAPLIPVADGILQLKAWPGGGDVLLVLLRQVVDG